MKRNKVNIIITMAGLGSRFRAAGYTVPKYMIEVNGKTLFEWSMDSLTDFCSHTEECIFIVRGEDCAEKFIQEKIKAYDFGRVEILELDDVTDGQATTALLGAERCEPELPILIYNIDTYIEPGMLKFSEMEGDGYIPCFFAPGTHWSFVETDSRDIALRVAEKVRISDYCSVGAYYFSSASLYRQLYQEHYGTASGGAGGERYIAPMYNSMIQKGYTVKAGHLPDGTVHVLGTPKEVEIFKRATNGETQR